VTTLAIIGDETDELRELEAWADGHECEALRHSLEGASTTPEALRNAALCVVDAAGHALLAVAVCGRLRAGDPGRAILVIGDDGGEFELAALCAGATVVLARTVPRDRLHAYARRFLRPVAEPRMVRLGPQVELDLTSRILVVSGHAKRLTNMKYEVLCYFIANRGRAVSANELTQRGLLQRSQAGRFRAIALELRRLLGPARELLISVPGHGYRLENEGGDSSV
jgi:DNA-binding response OmpR family regulator